VSEYALKKVCTAYHVMSCVILVIRVGDTVDQYHPLSSVACFDLLQ